MTRAEKADQLRAIAQERILVKDGPYGTAIQAYKLDEEGYRGGRTFQLDQKGNNDLLNLTRPDVVGAICNAYIDAGADLLATNTFNANAISLGDYGISNMAREINLAAARLTRGCADAATARDSDKPRFVAGALGPTNKTLSISPNVNDPGYRAVTFDEVKGMYREQIDGAARRRRRLHPDRDGVRHAERQGRDRGGRRGGRGARRGAPGHGLHDPDRSRRPQPLGPDGRGLLAFGAPRQAAHHGPQLLASARRSCIPT